MSGIEQVRLADCCDIISGATPSTSEKSYWGGEVAWATPKDLSNLNSKCISSTAQTLTELGYSSCSAKLIPAQSVLFSSRAPIGHVAINTIPMCTNQGFKSFVPNPKRVSPDYLYYWLKANKLYLQSLGNGATFKEVSKAIVAEVRIPLPELPEQRRIAAILDKADALRAKRREAIAKLDQLLQSVFLEMFGDPVTNPKGWPQVRFSELLESIDSGTSPVCLDRSASDNEWAVLKLSAVTRCEYDPSANKALPEGVEPDKSLEVKVGDLLFTRKNTRDLVAACAFVTDTPPRLLLPDLIFRFRLKPLAPVVPRYLQALLAFPGKRKDIQSLAGGSAGSMPNISKAKLSNALIELPPTDLQCEFERRLKHCDLLKEQQRLALAKLDATFFALQQRAFAE